MKTGDTVAAAVLVLGVMAVFVVVGVVVVVVGVVVVVVVVVDAVADASGVVPRFVVLALVVELKKKNVQNLLS